MKDKYDEAVEYLTANPNDIPAAWVDPFNHEGGELFKFASPNGQPDCLNKLCGCLTTIRFGADAFTPELTMAIRADERIPKFSSDIKPAHLPIFAEWQRRIDKELGRV